MPRDRGYRDPRTLWRLSSHVNTYLHRLANTNPEHLWTSRLPLSARDEVAERAADAHFRHGHARVPRLFLSPNDGHAVAVKDNIATTALPTSAASNILRGYVPPENATVIRLLEDAGLLVLGKTNMDEFGMGSHSLNSAFGSLTNGIASPAVSVGGSSGGSALAVATDLCHFAIGTDTGGSVRLPAAYLDIVGFKPSYGLISRHGVIPYANSLDTVGLLARSCLDIYLLLKILDEPDPKDPTCLDRTSRDRIKVMKRETSSSRPNHTLRVLPVTNLKNWNATDFNFDANSDSERNPRGDELKGPIDHRRRIGVPAEYNIQEMLPEVRTAWARTLSMLETFGHTIVPISLPSTKQALSAYYVLAPAEASSNLAKFDGVRYGRARTDAARDEDGVLYSGHRGQNFGDEVKRRILLGSFSLSAGAMDNYFIQAQKVRRMVQNDFNMVFRLAHPLLEKSRTISNGVDFIVCPTAPTFPPRVSTLSDASPLETYINDVFTVPASLAGLPAISIPAPVSHQTMSHIPETAIGMQVIGQFGDDYATVAFARRFIELKQRTQTRRRQVNEAVKRIT